MSARQGRRAAIYCRISRDATGEALGVTRQSDDCAALADQLGWEVVQTFVDNDRSAYSGKRRPEYTKLLAAIKSGEIDAVLAWHPDRLHRRPAELIEFIDLCSASDLIDVRTVKAGTWDPSPAGRAVAITLAAWAEYESSHKSDRVRRALLARAEAGQPVRGGTRGYGYNSEMEILPSEAKVIEQMAALVLDQGYTAGQVARWANEAGHTTSAGGPWRPRSVNELLCSSRLAGWRSHAPGLRSSSRERIYGLPFTHQGTWQPIVDRDTVERLREALTRNTSTRANPSARYLLSGLLWHDGCVGDGRFVGVMKGGVARYRCSPKKPIGHGCGGAQIVGFETERVVLDALVVHLGATLGRELTRAEPEGDLAQTLDAIRKVARAIQRLGDQLDDEEITREEFRPRRARLEARREALRNTLSEQETRAMSRPESLPGWANDTFDRGEFRRWWQDADVDARRAILKRHVHKVEVSPGTRGRKTFDESRLTVRFADGTSLKPAPRNVGSAGKIGELTIGVKQ